MRVYPDHFINKIYMFSFISTIKHGFMGFVVLWFFLMDLFKKIFIEI